MRAAQHRQFKVTLPGVPALKGSEGLGMGLGMFGRCGDKLRLGWAVGTPEPARSRLLRLLLGLMPTALLALLTTGGLLEQRTASLRD
ncbi:hypothetical protein [Deinococcus sp. QL22]|uniref:hypothetical protein n=1 Tax=Deinococcus sp. QL22 TaxID=2939437 RepID=UPI002017F69F|nr:hypothetical protein [Deinococcus sp. QL22]UQN08262.1 hypothetical protein M1R55_16095 [Deinococcus sp. QL22]